MVFPGTLDRLACWVSFTGDMDSSVTCPCLTQCSPAPGYIVSSDSLCLAVAVEAGCCDMRYPVAADTEDGGSPQRASLMYMSARLCEHLCGFLVMPKQDPCYRRWVKVGNSEPWVPLVAQLDM